MLLVATIVVSVTRPKAPESRISFAYPPAVSLLEHGLMAYQD